MYKMENGGKYFGLINSSLNGFILVKPYRRPDPININGVFDYINHQQSIQQSVIMNRPINNTMLNNNMVKLLNDNNITVD